jgi:hypothetical protein
MAQLEYGDYYKFTASAGITLIAGAVLVPWMFLREPFDLAMETSKIALLTPDAQNIIHTRQHLVAAAIHYLPLASGLMAITGLALTAYGLFSWRSRQSVRDKAEDLQNEKMDKELKAMSPEQIETRAKNDLEIEEEIEPPMMMAQPASPSAVRSVLAVEQALLGRISSCLGPSVKMMSNQRLGNVEFDAIIRTDKAHRIIVEIKYIRKGFNRGWVLETITNLSLRMGIYAKTFNENVSGLVLIVIATSNSPLARKVTTISDELRISHPSRLDNVRVRTIYEADIATIPCSELRNIVLDDLG